MRKISVWARSHRLSAIIYIVLIKLLLVLIAFYIGQSLAKLGMRIPILVCLTALVIVVTAAILYPRYHRSRSKRHFYVFQKSCDFIIGACSFVMIGTLVNNNFPIPATLSAATTMNSSMTPTAEEILASLQYRDKSTLTKMEKKILRAEFKKQLKIYVVAKVKGNKSEGDKAGLIILTIIAALGLLFLLAALSCSLACNGADGAAVAVLIVGLVAIVWGSVALIKNIKRKRKRKT